MKLKSPLKLISCLAVSFASLYPLASLADCSDATIGSAVTMYFSNDSSTDLRLANATTTNALFENTPPPGFLSPGTEGQAYLANGNNGVCGQATVIYQSSTGGSYPTCSFTVTITGPNTYTAVADTLSDPAHTICKVNVANDLNGIQHPVLIVDQK